ncbi:MAG TPA: arabinofuranosidase catalytic domain-containing protein [Verrucomicrobiae bacterium]
MKTKFGFVILLALALALPVATMKIAAQVGAGRGVHLPRPQGPCDIYAAAGTPCVAAHSSTRALYAAYSGPLYQVMRQSDGKKLDIGVVPSSPTDAGGYANAAAQDTFCANTYCWITTLYDQSGHKNDLTQAPRGPAGTVMVMGGFNNVPVADWAPVTIMGHKVYGVFISPGMGLRNDNPHGTAVEDQAEGQYWVVNGHHYNGGCCFDYGNAEIDSHDDGAGTMETAYFGNATPWYHGPPPGPWIMTDQENNLVGCVTTNGTKNCDLPIITWRFVTAMADGEPHHWRTMGGDAQNGELKIMFDGRRVDRGYDPMRKQGAIDMGNGGDNSNGSDGTVYEAAMTAAGTFPTQETQQKVQANVVAAKYDEQRVSIAPASATDTPPGLQTFSPGSSQATTVTFRNVSASPVTRVKLNISVPARWTSVVSGVTDTSKTFADPVAPGSSVSATFKVTSGPTAFNGDLVANASWTANGHAQSETMAEKVRNVSPVKINEFAVDPTDSFIELYNAGYSDVDLSSWTLTQHPIGQPIFSTVKIPAGTKLASKAFYLLGLADSGLVVPAQKGDITLYVRSTTGMNVGDTIQIDTGSAVETRKIASIGTAAGNSTTLWQPLPDGPVITIPPGSTSVPFTSAGGGFGGRGGGGTAFEVGQKLGLGYGATQPAVANTVEKYEVVTVTEVGKPGTETTLAADAKAGDTTIRARNARDISVGDKINLDIDSVGHGTETITVKSVGTVAGGGGRGGGGASLELEAPLKFNHANNLPFSVRGTGISFQPATAFAHSSNEPLQPLGTGITLDSPLANNHEINAVVRDATDTTAGYQGLPAPNQWFGGPALANGGNMVLHDAAGLVVDSLNYGRVVDPWAAEGYQGASPGDGNFVSAPGAGRGGFGRRGGPAAAEPSRSAGRFPDGTDTDDNRNDFHLQTASSLAAGSDAGANNIKVSSVADFAAGQRIIIDSGANRETAVIATVGTPGGTTEGTATEVGATSIPVANAFGFSPGQTITIDSGANRETAVVASIAGGRGRGGFGRGGGVASITVAAPLTMAHAVEAQVSGSGITLTGALTKSHDSGAAVAGSGPTPGAPNQYARRN